MFLYENIKWWLGSTMNFLKKPFLYLLIIGFVSVATPCTSAGESDWKLTAPLCLGATALLVNGFIPNTWNLTNSLTLWGVGLAACASLGWSLFQSYHNHNDSTPGKERWGNPGLPVPLISVATCLGTLYTMCSSLKSGTDKGKFLAGAAILSTIPHWLYEIWP
jgi:hypothetical protein